MQAAISQIVPQTIPNVAQDMAAALFANANTTDTQPTCSFHDLIHTPRSMKYLCNTAANHLCLDKFDQVNFYNFYWCQIDGNLPLLLFVYAVLIFILFKYTSIAVDEFVAEGITKISEFLGFSESLAAVTLLAFANGAGDVITALVASGQEGGVSYNIGALYGAGLFVCSMVIVICIFLSEEPIVYDPMIIYRDIGIYLFSTVLTAVLAWYGYLTWWNSCILLGLYVVLVLLVVFFEKGEEEEEGEMEDGKPKMTLITTEDKDTLIKTVASHLILGKPEENKKQKIGQQFKDAVINVNKDDKDKKEAEKQNEEKVGDEYISGNQPEEVEVHGDSSMEAGKAVGLAALLVGGTHMKEEMKGKLNKKLLDMTNASIRTFLKIKLAMIKEKKQKSLEKKSIVEVIFHVIDLPGNFVFYLTALPAAEDEYEKKRCQIYCVPGMLFMWWVIHPTLDLTYLYIALPAGLILLLIFSLTLPKDKPPKWSILLDVLSVVAGLMWTKVFIEILVDMLSSLSVILNLESAYLGLTILAIGNALPDALTTISLCQSGVGTMAISGGYAGQLFGYLIGFGLAMLKQTLTKGPQKFDLFDLAHIQENFLDLVVIGTAFLVLSITFVFGLVNKFRMNRVFAVIICVVYCIFLVGSSIYAIRRAILYQ